MLAEGRALPERDRLPFFPTPFPCFPPCGACCAPRCFARFAACPDDSGTSPASALAWFSATLSTGVDDPELDAVLDMVCCAAMSGNRSHGSAKAN